MWNRLFFGKTKVMAKALGTSPEEEYQANLSSLAKVWFFLFRAGHIHIELICYDGAHSADDGSCSM